MNQHLLELDNPTYIVQPDDTIEGIAIRTGVKVSTLRRINKIYGNVMTGQILKLYSPPAVLSPKNIKSQSHKSICEFDDKVIAVFENTSDFAKGDERPKAAAVLPIAFESVERPPASLKDVEIEATPPTTIISSNIIRSALEEEFPVIEGGESKILNRERMILIHTYLPVMHQFEPWALLYSLYDHGADMITFYNRVQGYQKTVLVVETENGEVFGGYASGEWKVSTTYCGNGQSFLFKFTDCGAMQYYKWTEENDFFMRCSSDQIAMGGGGDGFGFVLDKDFLTGGSSKCLTFNNDPLTSDAQGVFNIVNVEVFGFASSLQKSFRRGYVHTKKR